jgi:hypothetical protein
MENARKPIKGSKVRGSILTGNHPDKLSVFEDPGPHPRAVAQSSTKAYHAEETYHMKESVQQDRMTVLENAVKGMISKNSRVALDVKTLADRGMSISPSIHCTLWLMIKSRRQKPISSN